MGSLTITAKNFLLDHIYKSEYTPPADIYLALFIGDPAGAGVEVNADTYARKTISFGAAAARSVTQDAEVEFDEANASWGGVITNFALMDAATAGNMLGYGEFNNSFSVVVGNTPKVPAGECVVTISPTVASAAGMSTWAANKLLDLMFRGTAWPTPSSSIYIAMSNSSLNDADTVTADFTEQDGTGYNRTNVPASSMTAAVDGAIENFIKITLATPTGNDWSEVVSLVVLDDFAAGNIVAYENASFVDQTPGFGDVIEIPVGEFSHDLMYGL